MKSKSIHFRVEEEHAKKWLQLASSKSITRSELSRQILGLVLSKIQEENSSRFSVNPNEREPNRKQIKVRLTKSEFESFSSLCSDFGLSHQQCLVSLIRSFVTGSVIISSQELDALLTVSHEINKVGINLNQIARKINQEAKTEGVSKNSIDKANESIASTKEIIQKASTSIENFLAKNRSRGKIVGSST